MNITKLNEIINLEKLIERKKKEYWDKYYKPQYISPIWHKSQTEPHYYCFDSDEYVEKEAFKAGIKALEKFLKEKKDSYEGDFEEDYSKYKAELDIEKLQNQVKDLKSEIKELKEEIVKLENTQSKPKRKWLNIFKKQ